MFEQQRAGFAALANAGVGRGFAIAGADDVAVAGEQLGLDELQLAIHLDRRVDHQEQGIAEGFQLGPGVTREGVFQGQFVQVELPLQVAKLLCAGVMQTDPDEVPRLAGPFQAFIEGYVGDFPALGVHSGGNDSTHGSAVPSSVVGECVAELNVLDPLSLAVARGSAMAGLEQLL
ncbi:hypothetical protein D9M72_256700 [compost metagenome]